MTIKIKDAPTLDEILNFNQTGLYPKAYFKDGRWREEDLILVGGAITTKDRFGNFDESLAHLFEDGTIMCHHTVIGKFEDLIIVIKEGE